MRFPGFSASWKTHKLGEVAQFSKGKGIPKKDICEEGKFECIRYGELYTHYGEVINKVISKTDINKENLIFSEENDVIIPSSGETQLDIATASCVIRTGIALGGDLNIIKTPNNGVFLSYYLNNNKKIKIARMAQGSSVVHLYSKQLASLKINFPLLEEQNMIASFLTLIDKRIRTQNKIIQRLESLSIGLKERVFSRKLNFKKKDGSSYPKWALKKLGNFLTIPLKESPDKINPSQILTVKLHLKGILLNDRVDSLKLGATKYIIRRKGQFIYGKQNLFNGAFGIVPGEFDGFLSSGDVPSLDINCDLINPMFLFHFLGREAYYKRFEAIASGSGSKRIHENTLLSHRILIPSIEEQNKIASFLTTIEKKIQMEKDILESLQIQKQYLLQQLFV